MEGLQGQQSQRNSGLLTRLNNNPLGCSAASPILRNCHRQLLLLRERSDSSDWDAMTVLNGLQTLPNKSSENPWSVPQIPMGCANNCLGGTGLSWGNAEDGCDPFLAFEGTWSVPCSALLWVFWMPRRKGIHFWRWFRDKQTFWLKARATSQPQILCFNQREKMTRRLRRGVPASYLSVTS